LTGEPALLSWVRPSMCVCVCVCVWGGGGSVCSPIFVVQLAVDCRYLPTRASLTQQPGQIVVDNVSRCNTRRPQSEAVEPPARLPAAHAHRGGSPGASGDAGVLMGD